MTVDHVIDYQTLGKIGECAEPMGVGNGDVQNIFHGRQTRVDRIKEQEGSIGDAVVAAIRVLTIGSTVAVITREPVGAGVCSSKLSERNNSRRISVQHLTGVLIDDAPATELLSPAFSLAVIHDQIAFMQPAGGAKVQNHVTDLPSENDGCVAKWAKGDGQR